MAKKLFISFAIIILSVCCSVCFAADNNGSNVNLGDEITDSLDRAGDSVRNVAGDAMNGVDNMITGDMEENNTRNNVTNDRTTRNNNNMNNNNVGTAGYNAGTNGYNAVRTSVDEATTGNMSTTTWMWIILAVAAIVIVAMVWYYAVQDNNRD